MNASISKFRLLMTIKKKIKMLTIYPLATFAQGFCCHVFEVLTRTFWKRTYAYLILLNFRGTLESRIIIHPNPR
jgi:hypothetical protein